MKKYLLLFILTSPFILYAEEFMFGVVGMVDIDDRMLEYRQYDVGFHEKYTKYKENGFDILKVKEAEFVIFRTPNWIYLYPRDIDDFISLLGATKDKNGFYLVSEAVGNVYFPSFILGTKKSLAPPSDSNHVPFNEIEASSSLTEIISGETRRYSAENLMNWDISKAWVEGSSSDGTNENLSMKLNKGTRANRLIFYIGYFDPTNLDLFYKNTRPRKIEVKTDSGFTMTVELEDRPGPQIINIPEYSNAFDITISSVYAGSIYSDCAFSGIFADGETVQY